MFPVYDDQKVSQNKTKTGSFYHKVKFHGSWLKKVLSSVFWQGECVLMICINLEQKKQ